MLPRGLRLPIVRQLIHLWVSNRFFGAREQWIAAFLTSIDTAIDMTWALDLSLRYGLLHQHRVRMVQG